MDSPAVTIAAIDFLARLAALVPKPRVNLARIHGVFAPNSKHRVHVTPAKRGDNPLGASDIFGILGFLPALPSVFLVVILLAIPAKGIFCKND